MSLTRLDNGILCIGQFANRLRVTELCAGMIKGGEGGVAGVCRACLQPVYAWFTRVYSSNFVFVTALHLIPAAFLVSQRREHISDLLFDADETIEHLEKTSSSSSAGGGGGTSGGRPGRPVDLPRPKTRMDTPSSTNNVHQIVKAQIVFLLSTLTEENFEQNQLQIRSVSVLRFRHFSL